MNDLEKITVKKYDDKYVLINTENPSWISLSEEGYELFLDIDKYGVNNVKNIEYSKDELKDFYESIIDALFSPVQNEHITDSSLSLTVFLTTACNFKCRHCFYGCGTNNNTSMLKYDYHFESFIDEFYENGGKFVTFTGGEPLLNPDLERFIRYVHDKNIGIALLTNGSLLTDSLCSMLSKYHVILQASLDGNKEDFMRVRNGGNFEKVIHGLSLLKKYKLKYEISFMPCKLNADSIDDIIAIARKYDAINIHMPLFEEYGSGKDNKELIGMSMEEYKTFFSSLMDRYYNNEFGDVHISIFDNIENDLMYATRKTICKIGSNVMALYSNGNIFPCSEFIEDKFIIGNYQDGYPKMKFNKIISDMRCCTIEKIEKCKRCAFKHYCGGGCRLHSYIKFNSMMKEDSHCELIYYLYDKVLEHIS